MILCGLAKPITRHSLTELNIIIFHDGLFNISYCYYNQQEKLENNYQTLFWKSELFFKKSKGTHMLGPPSPCLFLFAFRWPPPPPSHRQRTYFLNDPLNIVTKYSILDVCKSPRTSSEYLVFVFFYRIEPSNIDLITGFKHIFQYTAHPKRFIRTTNCHNIIRVKVKLWFYFFWLQKTTYTRNVVNLFKVNISLV